MDTALSLNESNAHRIFATLRALEYAHSGKNGSYEATLKARMTPRVVVGDEWISRKLGVRDRGTTGSAAQLLIATEKTKSARAHRVRVPSIVR
jgi:hypothetical protein